MYTEQRQLLSFRPTEMACSRQNSAGEPVGYHSAPTSSFYPAYQCCKGFPNSNDSKRSLLSAPTAPTFPLTHPYTTCLGRRHQVHEHQRPCSWQNNARYHRRKAYAPLSLRSSPMVDKHHGRGDHGDSVDGAYPQDEKDLLIYSISRANDIESIVRLGEGCWFVIWR